MRDLAWNVIIGCTMGILVILLVVSVTMLVKEVLHSPTAYDTGELQKSVGEKCSKCSEVFDLRKYVDSLYISIDTAPMLSIWGKGKEATIDDTIEPNNDFFNRSATDTIEAARYDWPLLIESGRDVLKITSPSNQSLRLNVVDMISGLEHLDVPMPMKMTVRSNTAMFDSVKYLITIRRKNND